MGVASFYRWLVNKYPKIVSDASEEKQNGLEFDNLYLDMNGIIHPCFHPEDNLFPPTTFEEVFENIVKYVDELFNIVRPRKLLYMAIDGVAPRAKMNQQRTRRFRTAKDAEVAEEVEKMFRKQFEMEGKKVLPKEESELSDSNIITPGTEFMSFLSSKLQCYIKRQMTNDSRWKRIKVILSDANVPGEGEHKIMSFIRAQRSSEGYNPNTRHCLYGLDADLIMLALATHEVHFSILRESILSESEPSARKAEAYSGKCRGWFKQKPESVKEPGSCHTEVASGSEKPYKFNGGSIKFNRRESGKKNPFEFLHVWLLREYLQIDMNISNPPENVKVELERIVDDFIFICFFTGNDFLPHMPTLEIQEGAIDLLMHVYREEFKDLGGYLVDTRRIEDKKGGYIKLKRVEKFIISVGKNEEEIFKKRSEIKDRKLRRIQSDLLNAQETEDYECIEANLQSSLGSIDHSSLAGKMSSIINASRGFDEKDVTDFSEVLENTAELKQKLKDYIRYQSDTFKNGVPSDKVRLAVPGWKKRYYEEKFSAKTPEEIESMRKKLVGKYTEGLCWVLKYYFSGVPSWTWFYPYYYGPFASDLKGFTGVKVKFQKGFPLKPFEQLLAVLPPRSGHALPEGYKKLMSNDESKIVEFYPTSFQMDADGKRFMWQAICKVPFIQEDRLLEETRKVEKELKSYASSLAEILVTHCSFRDRINELVHSHFMGRTLNLFFPDRERERNAETPDQLFVGCSSGLGEQIKSAYNSYLPLTQNDAIMINNNISNGIHGFMHLCKEKDPDVLCVHYKLPQDFNPTPHLVEGVNIPDKTITEADIVETSLWHRTSCSAPHRLSVNKNCVLISSPKNRESEIIHKGAGIGWGRGRGKSDDSSLRTGQYTAVKSHARSVGNKFHPSSSRSTSASSLSSRCERQLVVNASGKGWNGWQSTDKGSWRQSLTSSPSPDRRQSQSFSSDSPGQQAQDRGQYVSIA